MLDVGAGSGLWRDWFAAHKTIVRYPSTDTSDCACECYIHEQRDIARWRAPAAHRAEERDGVWREMNARRQLVVV